MNPGMRLTHLHTLKVSFTSMLWTQIKHSVALVIPKSRGFTVLVEGHEKLGHQGANRTYHIIKLQYYWKGMNKDIHKYINNCALCKRQEHMYIHNR